MISQKFFCVPAVLDWLANEVVTQTEYSAR